MDHFYNVYLDSCFKLVLSMVIKNTVNADTMNEQITALYGNIIDYDQPDTWRYYLHLSGSYHWFDRRMMITSLDTHKEIEFNISNLDKHPITKNSYQIGGIYYRDLLKQYPENALLIKGVLLPVDIDYAISEPDNTILTYEKSLIEYQESNVIRELNRYITSFKARWDVKAFYHSDELYLTANEAILYLNLVPKLLNIRLMNCKTEKAHTYHIREYLKSHNGLDKYLPYFTLKQMLFLYRNINYIEANAGKQETFDWLIERILTERYIPIHEYSLRHSAFKENKDNDFYFKRKH